MSHSSIGIHDIEQIIKLHDKIIEETGGVKGILNIGLLEEALARPFIGLADGTEFYTTIEEKATVLFEALINLHPFTDGNKRTAVFLAYTFASELNKQANRDLLIHHALSIAKNNIVDINIIERRLRNAIN